VALMAGHERFSETARTIEGISSACSRFTLKGVERDGLVTRRCIPPSTACGVWMTKLGRSLWSRLPDGRVAEQNREKIQPPGKIRRGKSHRALATDPHAGNLPPPRKSVA